ncbi:DUF998 domain-containing protein [Actinomycetospora termitidis]|uniref:DUF998 domain-containing protein n=1 Tax=Actinomycetospora termitidis TaxID=3053470 RepID=A0ABT7M395_9PSEU|nr:DUF998 domain-containing protein [Actinomycetospora sp. Odt1-22]MDL5155139.1 DUF998 domain-containing protein [Actinomycetospora sp. Odt1-22]
MDAHRVGALFRATQPLYIVVELLVAAVAAPYDLVTSTISELGVAAVSPEHAVINGAFVLFGVTLTLGAVLGERPSRTARVLWVIAGLSSVATGLAPLDTAPVAHFVVSTPVFLAQPVALLLTGLAVRSRTAAALGVVSIVASAVFLLGLAPELGGLLERLALWPGYLVLGVLGVRTLARASAASAG